MINGMNLKSKLLILLGYQITICQQQQQIVTLQTENKSLLRQLQISQSKVIELETSLHLKKQQFDEFTAKVTLEMNQRINQIQTVVKRPEMEELQEKLDRVLKDNSLFDILLNERENKIQSLQQQMKLSDNLIKDLNEEISSLRKELQKQEQKYNQQAQNLNKNLDEYNCIQKELDDCKETLQVLIKNKYKGIK